jgi:hypothetical protein
LLSFSTSSAGLVLASSVTSVVVGGNDEAAVGVVVVVVVVVLGNGVGQFVVAEGVVAATAATASFFHSSYYGQIHWVAWAVIIMSGADCRNNKDMPKKLEKSIFAIEDEKDDGIQKPATTTILFRSIWIATSDFGGRLVAG